MTRGQFLGCSISLSEHLPVGREEKISARARTKERLAKEDCMQQPKLSHSYPED